MRLAKLAFYDEALSLVRSIGEIVNLLALFAADKAAVKGGEKLGQQGGVKLDQREIFEKMR
jgi:hypothetical protein